MILLEITGSTVSIQLFLSYQFLTGVLGAGPAAGAVISAGFYKLLKFIHYHTANPGQDAKVATPEPPVDNLPKDESEGRGLTRIDTHSGYSVSGPSEVPV